jgi:hypothetical protein
VQKSWYFIGADLPDAVLQLIEQVNAPSDDDLREQNLSDDDHDPCSVEEAAAVLGLQRERHAAGCTSHVRRTAAPVRPEREGLCPARSGNAGRSAMCRRVRRGTITRLYNRNPTHGWSYDVDFSRDRRAGWFFERELTSLEPTPGIRVTRGSVVPPGAVPPPTDAEVKRALVEGGHQPEAIVTDAETPPVSDTEDEEEPKIRIIKPVLSDDDSDPVTTAVRQTRPETISVLQPTPTTNGRRNLVRIPQSACGELTGSITGNVWCYGYAVHEGVCVYVNMGGPRMAVEAIRAKMSKA